MAETLFHSPYIPPGTFRERVRAIWHVRVILQFDWSKFAVNENLTGNACLETVHVQTDASDERDYVSVIFHRNDGVGSGNQEWRIPNLLNIYMDPGGYVGGEERSRGTRVR